MPVETPFRLAALMLRMAKLPPKVLFVPLVGAGRADA
jgi:hypothetical protein